MAATTASPPANQSVRRSTSRSSDALCAHPEEQSLVVQPRDDSAAASSQQTETIFNAASKSRRRPVLPESSSLLKTLSIIGGVVFAIVLAAGHHFFLLYLHGQNIEQYSQFWVKGASNALSNALSLSLVFSITCALVQIKWRVASSRPLQISAVDDLFALPSPLALLGSIRLGSLLLLPIGATAFIHALVIVNVLAPNALTIALSERVTKEIQIPTLALDRLTDAIAVSDTNLATRPLLFSRDWEMILNSILFHPPESNWKIPRECGFACSFELEYDGVALQCRDITLEEYRLSPGPFDPWFNMTGIFYQAIATIPPNLTTVDIPYDLTINHAQMRRGTAKSPGPEYLSVHPGGGAYCQLRNATYRATFDFSNNAPRISTRVKSYGNAVSSKNCRDSRCNLWQFNIWAIFSVFANAFQGIEYLTGVMQSPPWNQFVTSNIYVKSLFTFNTTEGLPPGTPVLYLAPSNLSETMTERFGNLTLGIIPHRFAVATVKAATSTGISVWEYTWWKLWAVYGSAFLLGLPIAMYGLYCVHLSNVGMDDKFSNYLLATRGDDLDEVCEQAMDFEDLQRVRLVYHKGARVFTVGSEADRDESGSVHMLSEIPGGPGTATRSRGV